MSKNIPVKSQSRSLKVVPFDIFGMVSYLCSMVTLALRRTVFEILTRASEAGVCRGSDTPNYLCGGDIDMYIPPRKT